MVTSIPSPLAETHASDVMRSHGYRVTGASAAGVASVAENVFFAMQFGNEALAFGDGIPALPVTATLRLRDGGATNQVSRWSIGKSFVSPPGPRQVCLPVHIDMVVAGDVSPTFFDECVSHSFTHLRTLILDARDTLTRLSRSKKFGAVRGDIGPTVHIEVVSIGDLVAGRSGLLKSSRLGFTADEIALRLRACDVLELDVLSDVAAALCAIGISGPPSALSKSGDEVSSLDPARRPACAAARPVAHLATPCVKSQNHL